MRAKFTLLLGLADAIVIDVKLADGLPCGGISDFNITFCHCFGAPSHPHSKNPDFPCVHASASAALGI
jgi:hypothetical protein